jgi:DNA-binding MarR family transcriptional regulator
MENPATTRGRTSETAAQFGAAPRAVHPGWLLPDPVEIPADSGPDEATRFAAFRQLMRTSCALDRAAVDALADLDLTAGAFFALLELEAAGPKGLAPSELARRLAVARRTATLYVDILARQGWVERQAHPDDRRMVLAHLTPVGTRLLTELGAAYKRRLAGLLGEISPIQAERLRQLLALVPLDVERPAHADAATGD